MGKKAAKEHLKLIFKYYSKGFTVMSFENAQTYYEAGKGSKPSLVEWSQLANQLGFDSKVGMTPELFIKAHEGENTQVIEKVYKDVEFGKCGGQGSRMTYGSVIP